MREEEALFTLYKRGWQQNLVPRGAAGWWALAWWLIALVPFVGAFVWYMSTDPAEPRAIAAVALYVLFMAIWTVSFVLWAKAHSVTVDLAENDRPATPRAVAGSGAEGRKPWFAAKRIGYGAGPPIAWQGWALIAVWLGAIGGAGLLQNAGGEVARQAGIALFVASTVCFVIIALRRTAPR